MERRDVSSLHLGTPMIIEQVEMKDTPESLDCFPNDEIGINSIKLIDSLIVVGHKNYWSIYDKTDKRHIGKFLSVGNGPDEFLYLRPCSNAYFGMVNDSLCALIPDMAHHRIIKLNLQKCKTGLGECQSTYIENDIIDNSLWDVTVYGPDSYLVTQPHADMRGFNRILVESGESHSPVCTFAIDSVKVSEDGYINLLSKVTRYDPTADKFVEAMGYLNQINIISGDGKIGKTICVGKQLDNISEKEETFLSPRRKESYVTITAWPYGFGAIYSGISDLQRMTGLNLHSELQIFDWEGNPKYRCLLPGYILALDIDFDEKILYAVDEQEDILKAYDATPIIESLL